MKREAPFAKNRPGVEGLIFNGEGISALFCQSVPTSTLAQFSFKACFMPEFRSESAPEIIEIEVLLEPFET